MKTDMMAFGPVPSRRLGQSLGINHVPPKVCTYARALEVIRHHRLVELYLVRRLGFTWDEVHSEAEILEHAISKRLEQRIAEDLGDVRADPHGHPVPTEDGQIHEENSDILFNYSVGDRLCIIEVMDDDSDALRYIGSLGILPGCSVEILDKTPFEGPIRIKVDSNVREITPNLASMIYATRRRG